MKTAYLLAATLLLSSVHAQDNRLTIKVDRAMTRADFVSASQLSLGRVCLMPDNDDDAYWNGVTNLTIDATVPREKFDPFLLSLLKMAGIPHRDYGPCLVVLPRKALGSSFRIVGTEHKIAFVRPASTLGANPAATLVSSSVRTLLTALKEADARTSSVAASLLGLFGPRSDEVVDGLVSTLPRVPTAALAALTRLGHASKRALPHLRKHADEAAFAEAIQAIETARHPDLAFPNRCRAAAPATFRARFETTKGAFVVVVHRDWAPLAADRFYHLVRIGFFDNTAIFRVMKGFVAQWGKSSEPQVNAAWFSATLEDEARKESNTRGRLSFAKSNRPNSRSTQVFVNVGANSGLDGQGFAPFGEVESGMDVVDAFYAKYGNRVNQERYHFGGNEYIDKNFPKIDRIKKATLLPADPK